MKQKTSVFICLLCIFSSCILNLEAKLRYIKGSDPSMDFYPIDPYLFEDDHVSNRNHPKAIDINFEDDTAISDTDHVLKAIKELLTYESARWLHSPMTDDEHHNLFQFIFGTNNYIFRDAYLDYSKIRRLGKITRHNKKFIHLFVKNDVLTPDENILALINDMNWTENEVPGAILKHIETQRGILKAYMDKYGPTIDGLCKKYSDFSGA